MTGSRFGDVKGYGSRPLEWCIDGHSVIQFRLRTPNRMAMVALECVGQSGC
ncbi:hypothetical protein FHR34_008116 [Kitasatospora kifunensis]|uniref:Uncharacterized protein n=1 Tax=Kitasatospora kifunensis TaxID=58351 RepID=A0A7W7RBS5_KITKI|nr:hypothetical protein [Kitasatospora kifunensis]